MRTTRREFLQHTAAGSALFFLGATPGFHGHVDNDRILVLLQLSGGNDGLSTVVPHGDDLYARNRNRTRIPEGDLLKIDEHVGLHPKLAGLKELYDEGKVAIVQGVGYPTPNRSHFKSLDIWHAADVRGRALSTGWIGRLVDTAMAGSEEPNLVIHIGNRIPYALHASVHKPVAFTTPQAFRWTGADREVAALEAAAPLCEKETRPGDTPTGSTPFPGRDSALARMRQVLREAQASSSLVRKAEQTYKPKVKFPATPVATQLATVAALISGGLGTRIYSVDMGGFDTHVNQKNRHDRLMEQVSGAVTAFMRDLEKRNLANRVCVLAFSEFGRRLKENGSAGTDHGVAGPLFLIGGGVKGGLHGRHPSLSELDKGDLIHNVDFRRVYASVIDTWFEADHREILGREWQTLPIISRRG